MMPFKSFRENRTHAVFLDGNVCEMDEHVVEFVDVRVVLDRAKATETQSIP